MNKSENLLETLNLSKGLVLNVYDSSKRIAGDRWQVCMIARMDIPVVYDPAFFSVGNADEFRDFQNEVKNIVRYEQKRVRNFIDEKNKNLVLQNLVESFLRGSLTYLKRPAFPGQYVVKQYKEHLKKKARGYQ